MPTVFVVEDDASLRDELKRLLDLQGYACRTTTDFGRAADEIVAARPDCVVLDLKLPGTGGHAVCRDVRRKSAVPIIMLTSSDSEFDEVMSMNLGADDYVTKPYRPAVLLARIEAVLRRAAPAATRPVVEHKGVVLDVAKGTVAYEGRAVELTRNECRILQALLEKKGQVVSRQLLMERLWASDSFVDETTLSVNMTRVRRKLEAEGLTQFISTRKGLGYIIE